MVKNVLLLTQEISSTTDVQRVTGTPCILCNKWRHSTVVNVYKRTLDLSSSPTSQSQTFSDLIWPCRAVCDKVNTSCCRLHLMGKCMISIIHTHTCVVVSMSLLSGLALESFLLIYEYSTYNQTYSYSCMLSLQNNLSFPETFSIKTASVFTVKLG